jgi:hypothetical protein
MIPILSTQLVFPHAFEINQYNSCVLVRMLILNSVEILIPEKRESTNRLSRFGFMIVILIICSRVTQFVEVFGEFFDLFLINHDFGLDRILKMTNILRIIVNNHFIPVSLDLTRPSLWKL